jgi:hypothetical protein
MVSSMVEKEYFVGSLLNSHQWMAWSLEHMRAIVFNRILELAELC